MRYGRFSHLWSIYHQLAGDVGPVHLGLSKYNSPLVRTGPHYLVTTDPNVWRHVNGARSIYQRDAWWAAGRIDYQRPSLADALDSTSHNKMKAKVAGGYSRRDVDLERIIDGQIAKFADVMRRKHVGWNKVDFADISRFFTLDVITRLAYGKGVRQIQAEADSQAWVGRVVGLGREEIKRRFAEDKQDDRDMIGSFMRHGLTVNEIEDEALIQIFASSDTTAIVLRSVILHLIATPRVCVHRRTTNYGRLRAYTILTCPPLLPDSRLKTDIKNAVSSGKVSTPIALAQAQSLPYLQAVIWEGFRMRPAVTYGHYKVVPPGGDTIAGIWVPGGTAIGHSHFGMMRNEGIFGKDVDVFRPERYLDEPNGDEMQRTVELVFGTGRWMCVGKQVALMELNKIFWELFRQFDFQLAHPDKAGWKETSTVTFTHREMWIKITEAEK
ncbi:hypothetical protein DL767_000581 [Monosporascus sp. MG133]|nr:hypothetical protein DL767_000581 [Monosporascus sp. MG133]